MNHPTIPTPECCGKPMIWHRAAGFLRDWRQHQTEAWYCEACSSNATFVTDVAGDQQRRKQ